MINKHKLICMQNGIDVIQKIKRTDMFKIKKTYIFFALKTHNSLFCYRDIPTKHNG